MKNTGKEETATIWVEWGYEVHSLNLDAEDWAAVKAGGEITICGDGYSYEGAEFSDTWHFKGGIGGELLVTYCGEEEGSEGEGYIGSLTEDMIEIHAA